MRERFWAIVHDELQRSRLSMAETCEGVLKDQIEQLTNRIRADGWLRDEFQVEDDFRRLVREMVAAARRKGYSELHEDTFYDGRAAAGILCPGFWPFC